MTTLPPDRIVNVNVSKTQGIPSLEDFGLLCVFTENTAIPVGETRTFNDLTSFNAVFSAASSMKDFGGVFFAQSPIPTKLLVARVDATSTPDYPATIEAVKATNPFYGVAIDSTTLTQTVIESIAAKVEALELLMIIQSSATSVLALASALKTANNSRTAIIENDDVTVTTNRPDAAWWGYGITRQAGAINWANNTLAVTTPTTQSETNINAWLAESANAYAKIGTIEVTRRGTTSATQTTYIDQIQAEDYLKINIQQEILSLLNGVDKVPYTDAGVKLIEASIQKVIDNANSLNVLDPAFRATITAPSVTTVPPTQRAARIAPTITVRARLSGAINNIVINVNLEV